MTARFACASLFCRNFSTQTGVRAATTAVLAWLAASLWAVLPVTQPPQENPMAIDATAPIAIPCRRRVRDSPRRIDGTCMAFRPSIGGEAPYAARTATEAGANGTSGNAVRRYCCRWEGADFDTLLFFGSSRTNCCPLD